MKTVFICMCTIILIVTTLLLFILSDGEPFWPVLLRYVGQLSIIYFLSLMYRSLWRKYVKTRKYFWVYLIIPIIPIIPLLTIILVEITKDTNGYMDYIEYRKAVVKVYPDVQIVSPKEEKIYKNILPIEVLFLAPEFDDDFFNLERVLYQLYSLKDNRLKDVVIQFEDSARAECMCINKKVRNFLDISAIPAGKYKLMITLFHSGGRFDSEMKEVTIM